MSVYAEVGIRFAKGVDPQEVLTALIRSQWQPTSEGWYTVPLGEECSKWQLLRDANEGTLSELLAGRLRADDLFCLRLWWQGTGPGGEFFINKDCELSMSVSIERVLLHGRATDASWYVSRILPVFEDAGLRMYGWSWTETF